jgi:type IV pilus assembly protein PilM
VLALDIGSHSVKLVAVRHATSGSRVDTVAQAVLPPDAMHGHVLRHPAPVGTAIRTLLRDAGGRGGAVVTALPGPAVMMRRLTVQAAARAHLDAVIVRAVAAHIPAPLEQTVLDYQVLGPPGADGAVPVLAVAARRDLVQSYTAAVRAGGVEPSVVDVDVFALDRLQRALHPAAGDAIVVHVGARYAAVSLLRSDGPLVVGDVPVDTGVDPESLVRGVERALDLFAPEPAPAPLRGGIMLSGGAAGAPGLAAAFAARFECAVEVVDPFAKITRPARIVPDAGGPAFAVAVGLALRQREAGT